MKMKRKRKMKMKKKKDNNKTLMSSNEENVNDKTLISSNEENINDKTLMSSKEDDKTMNQNNNDTIKELNDSLDKIIDESKSFEDQIQSIKKVKNLDEYYYINNFDNKELEFKIFKLKLAYLSNIIDKKISKQMFGHTFETLANKLINTANKEENQIIVNDINENKTKLYEDETKPFHDYVIQPSNQHNNLIEANNVILDFHEKFNQMWFENIKIKELKNEQVILIGENSQNYEAFYIIKKILFFS